MKKIFFAVFIVFSLSVQSEAQIIKGYGVKLGMGISNSTWHYSSYNYDLTWDKNAGFSARLFADFFNYSIFSLEAEIGYSQKGIKDKIPITNITHPDGTGEFIDINNRLSYISAALMGKAQYKIGIFSPYAIIGPQLNYLADKKVDQRFEIVYNNFNKQILGFSAGIGSGISIQGLNLILEYRYEKDFSNNYKSSGIEIKNYSHSFLVGFQF